MRANCSEPSKRCAAWRDDVIVQAYVPGRAASIALLIGPGRCLMLPAAGQHLSADGRSHL